MVRTPHPCRFFVQQTPSTLVILISHTSADLTHHSLIPTLIEFSQQQLQLWNILVMVKQCKFFALGNCTGGQACTYRHEVTSSGHVPSSPNLSVLTPHFTTSSTSPVKRTGIPCRFYIVGRCNKGIECPYEHLIGDMSMSNEKQNAELESVNLPPEPIHVQDMEIEKHPFAAFQDSTREMEVRNLRGASVMFGLGAHVHELEFPADYSAVQIASVQLNFDAEAFQSFMATLGETVPLSSIRVKTVTKPLSTVANVQVRDTGFAQRLKLKADGRIQGTCDPDVAVTILQVGTMSESSVNRLQMSTVSCTWYKPSRTAWLHYNNIGKARAAERFIASRDYRIAGRKVQTILQVPERRSGRGKATIISVQLGNLDPSTSQATIEQRIPSHLTPNDVIMGKSSYSTSINEAAECVRALIDIVAPLEAWESNSTLSATQVKAIARFKTGEDARKAVNQLNGQKISQFVNSKLFVSPVVSVKFNVPKPMYRAIRGDFDELKSQVWDAGHVHIKAYPPVDPTQRLIAIRLYGEDAKAVAKAKSALEKILAGDVAMNEDSVIWDEFFTNPGGLIYLNELGHTHQGYVYRDMRKHRLPIYGSADSKGNIERALIEKLDSLIETTHYISLSAEDLRKALHGGFRRIVAALGKQKARFDIRQSPQIITITGSAGDLETARALLDQDLASDLENLAIAESNLQPDCAVCWTEAEEAYRTPCGHFYCGSCFANQCSSAGEGDLPVRCFGDSGNCSEALAIQEIKNALSSEAFEQLLEDSFITHIRTNPKSFQYCPTPDCQQVYRVSPDGVIFTCPSCLTPICTACQITSHDGITCKEYKRIATEGNEEFQKWKQENNVKDCPVCKVPIEKSYGCNHMECSNCKTHICWVCLETFDESGKCYGHMREVHRTFYDAGGEEVALD